MMKFTFWLIADNGSKSDFSTYVPILSNATVGQTVMAASNFQLPGIPITPVQTSYLTLTVAMLDPNYTAKLTEAQQQATMLANIAAQFYMLAPTLGIAASTNTLFSYNNANAQLAAMEQQATKLLQQMEAATSSTRAVNTAQRLKQIQAEMAALQELIKHLQQKPLPPL